MNAERAARGRKQLERRLAPLRRLRLDAPSNGWIRAIRDSLGMTARQLAARMGVQPSRIPVIEDAEITGATTLKTLRHVAEAMNCSFVYAFVPNEPLDEMLRHRALEKARADVARLDHTMRLENQAVLRSDLTDAQNEILERILNGSLRGLWDEEDKRPV